MLVLASFCALIAALNVAIIGLWQRRQQAVAGQNAELGHEKNLYAAFIDDLDRRLSRGDIDDDMAQEERVEAARALLKAGDNPALATHAVKALYPFIALSMVMIFSALLYLLFIGHPTLEDQPYKQRLQQWTHAAQVNPDSLSPPAMAAVLRQGAVSHGKEPKFWLFLGGIDMMAGNFYNGAKDYEQARTLSPQTFTAWSELGEALTFVAKGVSGLDAQQAFQKALAINPSDTRAHFYLGKLDLNSGHYDQARAHFQAALDGLAPKDGRRDTVLEQLRAVDTAETADKAMKTRISGMVAGLAQQLAANPDNPDGWARLLRSYDVLGDAAARDKAVQMMQAHYHDRPDQAAAILAKSQSAVGAENTGSMP